MGVDVIHCDTLLMQKATVLSDISVLFFPKRRYFLGHAWIQTGIVSTTLSGLYN